MKHPKLLSNQDGFALILALAMLAILSILGAFALTTSSTEVGISGNLRVSQEAFIAADRAVEFGTALVAPGTVTIDLTDHLDALSIGRSGLDSGVTGTNVVQALGRFVSPPPGKGASVDSQGPLFMISVSGQSADNRGRARLEAQMMIPLPPGISSGSEFTTTGGGG